MSYKKLLSLLAVSALALGACSTDEANDTAESDKVEDTEEQLEETDDDANDNATQQAEEESDEVFPVYGLTVSGEWTVDGYVIGHLEDEAATIPVNIVTDKESYNVYLLEDGQITEIISDEPEIEFIVENPSADIDYLVGVTPDDLGEVGDEASEEDFKRSEDILFEEVEETDEE